jgi:hypothetical protein
MNMRPASVPAMAVMLPVSKVDDQHVFVTTQVKYTETKMSFLHFLTSVCAIVGGIFTVAGIIDAFIYHGGQAIRKKVDLGKQI